MRRQSSVLCCVVVRCLLVARAAPTRSRRNGTNFLSSLAPCPPRQPESLLSAASMYWPLNVARRLLPPRLPATTAEEDDDADIHEPALHLAPAPPTSHPSHFVLLTASSIHLYSTRPAQCVASLKRTQKSLVDYGSNKKAWWRPGLSGERGAEIAVETTTSHVLIFTITVSDPLQAYSYSAAGPSSSKKGLAPSVKSLKNTFAAAAGEATGSWAAGNGELRIGDGQESQDRDRGVPLVAGGGAALEIRLKLAFKVDAGVSW